MNYKVILKHSNLIYDMYLNFMNEKVLRNFEIKNDEFVVCFLPCET